MRGKPGEGRVAVEKKGKSGKKGREGRKENEKKRVI